MQTDYLRDCGSCATGGGDQTRNNATTWGRRGPLYGGGLKNNSWIGQKNNLSKIYWDPTQRKRISIPSFWKAVITESYIKTRLSYLNVFFLYNLIVITNIRWISLKNNSDDVFLFILSGGKYRKIVLCEIWDISLLVMVVTILYIIWFRY